MGKSLYVCHIFTSALEQLTCKQRKQGSSIQQVLSDLPSVCTISTTQYRDSTTNNVRMPLILIIYLCKVVL